MNQDSNRITTTKDIKILYANADQLTLGKKHELQTMTQIEKPYHVAICKVKSKYGILRQLHEYEFDGYKVVNQTNTDTDEGRGIVILADTSIQHLVVDVKSEIEFNEACIIEVKLSGNDVLVFACFYRSPTNNELSTENNNKLNALLKSISLNKKYSHKCFVGDFNFPTINWEHWTSPHMEDSKEERFLDALRDSFLHQHVNEPIRCRGTGKPSTIDLIITGEENQIKNLEYLNPLGKSDHSSLVFRFTCYTTSKTTSKRYIYANADFVSMKNYLASREWKEKFRNVSDSKSVEDLWH